MYRQRPLARRQAAKGGFIGLTGGAGGAFAVFSGAGSLGVLAAGATAAGIGNAVISPVVDAASGLGNVKGVSQYAVESVGTAAGYLTGSATNTGLAALGVRTGATGSSGVTQVLSQGGRFAASNVADYVAASSTQNALTGFVRSSGSGGTRKFK